jgi:hypothetical protein
MCTRGVGPGLEPGAAQRRLTHTLTARLPTPRALLAPPSPPLSSLLGGCVGTAHLFLPVLWSFVCEGHSGPAARQALPPAAAMCRAPSPGVILQANHCHAAAARPLSLSTPTREGAAQSEPSCAGTLWLVPTCDWGGPREGVACVQPPLLAAAAGRGCGCCAVNFLIPLNDSGVTRLPSPTLSCSQTCMPGHRCKPRRSRALSRRPSRHAALAPPPLLEGTLTHSRPSWCC